MVKNVFNYKNRKLLEMYIEKKVQLTKIAQKLKISRQSVYNELKKGLTDENDYSSYSADKAQSEYENNMVNKILENRGEYDGK